MPCAAMAQARVMIRTYLLDVYTRLFTLERSVGRSLAESCSDFQKNAISGRLNLDVETNIHQ